MDIRHTRKGLTEKEIEILKKFGDKKILPWIKTHESIKSRTSCLTHRSYKNYGGRGIKCLITPLELKTLWFRDKAYLMKRPSVHRIDNDGHYTFDNCQYIELTKNVLMSLSKKTHCINGHPLSGKNVTLQKRKDKYGIYTARVCKACKKRNYYRIRHKQTHKFKIQNALKEIRQSILNKNYKEAIEKLDRVFPGIF